MPAIRFEAELTRRIEDIYHSWVRSLKKDGQGGGIHVATVRGTPIGTTACFLGLPVEFLEVLKQQDIFFQEE